MEEADQIDAAGEDQEERDENDEETPLEDSRHPLVLFLGQLPTQTNVLCNGLD